MFSFFQKKADPGAKKMPPWLLLLVAALGVGLILFGGAVQTKEEETQSDSTVEFDQMAYQKYLEERVTALCQSVGGVGDVTAVVTLGGSFEDIYATEWGEDYEEYVILGSGSSSHGMLLSRNAPQILGIGIVCHGSLSQDLQNELIRLLSTAFDTPTNRIYVYAG